jgi:ribosomal protein L30
MSAEIKITLIRSHIGRPANQRAVLLGLGLNKGDTITDSTDSPATIYDMFGNTWRTEPIDFFGIRRE